MSEPQTSEPRVTITDSQVGVMGDHAHVEGGIHFDQKGQQVDSQINVAGNYYDQRVYHTTPPANPRERRNRAAMLQLVRNTWIKGLLEQSLHGAALIELGLEYRPDAVDHPWDMVVQMPERPDRQLPPGTRIVEVFDESGGSLLILGEPGSGKTTMLLELARDLIARAEQDETLHIPVVFNLSSWAMKQQKLEDWLLDEMHTKYHIPKKVAQVWLENDALLLLLDGLDEVKVEVREKCLVAINAFREQYFVPLAVCSRTADYEDLTAKLHLEGAICLWPLTPTQIEAYLAGVGTELEAVRATLKHDPFMQEMSQSPLMLSIMTLAYSGLGTEDLEGLATLETRRQHLFDTFIERMFQRRTKEQTYTQKQTLHWLAWLSVRMVAHGQELFHIKRLQLDWLPEYEYHCMFRLLLFFWGMFSGFIGGLINLLIEGGMGPLCGGLIAGVLGGVFIRHLLCGGFLTFFLMDQNKKCPIESLQWSWHNARSRVFAKLVAGLLSGWLVIGIISDLVMVNFIEWLAACLLGGLIVRLSHELETRLAEADKEEDTLAVLLWLSSNIVLSRVLCPVIDLFFQAIIGIFHHTFRYVLILTNCIPWNHTRFLDYCVKLVFLRKVGEDYVFIHRLLQEYFAGMGETCLPPCDNRLFAGWIAY